MEYTKEEIKIKLRKAGFSDIVKYGKGGRATNYQLELAIDKAFK